MDNLINPNGPDEEAHHNAFLVDTGEFDRAAEILMARNIRIVKYSDEDHQSFPGRYVYFHDVDGNAIEISGLYEDDQKWHP
jgi:catechol 2,3-dioxygenase-like lactoylglutathione lyase family enzyme